MGSSSQSAFNRDTGEDRNEEHERAVALLDLSISLIDQALDILNGHLREDRQLTHASKLMPGGSVGKHFRHVRFSVPLHTCVRYQWRSDDHVQVMEMFRALLLSIQPDSASLPPGTLEVNYDEILPSTRRPLARSLSACRKAMTQIKADLQSWRSRSQSGVSSSIPGSGVAGDIGSGGLVDEMNREVRLVAVTPTKQVLKSSVGREVLLNLSSLSYHLRAYLF